MLLDPVGDLVERLHLEPAVVHPAALPPVDQTGSLEHAQLLRDGGRRDPERLAERGHGARAARKPSEHRPPGRVRQRPEGRIQRLTGVR